jgi:fumarate reductase flavoprotein subunit
LKQAVDQHNQQAALDETLQPIQQGPFYALGPVKSWIVFSEGGLKIDPHFRVLDRQGQPIKGLYAAGSAGQGGLLLEGHGHHLAWAFTSGRLAGEQAAKQTPLGERTTDQAIAS